MSLQPRPINPYIAGNPVGGGPAFVGRDDVLREALRVLRQPEANAIVLYGQRRIGKTSMLKHLLAQLPQEGPFCPVYIDLQDKSEWPLGRVLGDLARMVSTALGQPVPDLGAAPESAFRETWLPSVLAALPAGCSLVLLLDEFDVLADPERKEAARAFFSYLNDLLAFDRPRLQFVFVIGRNVDDLDSIALAVFKGAPSRRVSLLSWEDAARLARLAEANGSLRWSDEAVEQVWQLACGHPYLTQQLCWFVWERAYDEEPDEMPTVAPDDVDAAVDDALDAARNALEWLWNGLPSAARVVAAALAEAGPAALNQDELERRLREGGVRVVIRELQNAPRLLQEWDVLEADGGRAVGGAAYRFRVELLRQWIARYKPLRRVQEELDQLEPEADAFYLAAQRRYQAEEFERAVELLNQAVVANPYHEKANLLLATILEAQGKIQEARQLLERLAEYRPAAARPRLVDILLTQARGESGEDEKLELYGRVLVLSPGQSEAMAGKREIWEERGDTAHEEGRLEAALEAYREVDLSEKAATVEQKIERRNRRDTWYQDAVDALQAGDDSTALKLFVEVVGLDPHYKETTRYLHQIVTGIDMKRMQSELEVIKEQLGKGQNQLETVLEEKTKFAKQAASLKKAQEDTEKQVKALEGQLEAATTAKEDAEKRIKALEGQLETVMKAADDAGERIKTLEDQLEATTTAKEYN